MKVEVVVGRVVEQLDEHPGYFLWDGVVVISHALHGKNFRKQGGMGSHLFLMKIMWFLGNVLRCRRPAGERLQPLTRSIPIGPP